MSFNSLIDMTPDDFVTIKDIQSKIKAIDSIIDPGYDYHPTVVEWFRDVLLKEKETGLYDSEPESPGAELLLRLVQSVGKDVHEKDIQELLTALFFESKIGSSLFYIIERILVASIDDELETVQTWAVDLLKRRDILKDSSETQTYLIEVLKGDYPYYLQEEAIIALGYDGTEKAILALENFGKRLLTTPQKGLYQKTRSDLLKEKVAYALGLTGNQNVIRTLTALQLFSDDPDVKAVALKAIERLRSFCLIDNYKIAVGFAGDRANVERRLIFDIQHDYELEISIQPTGGTKISIFSSTKLELPDCLKLTLLIDSKETPIVECLLERDSDQFEFLCYIVKTLAIHKIQSIEVLS